MNQIIVQFAMIHNISLSTFAAIHFSVVKLSHILKTLISRSFTETTIKK